jgi:RNA polymerase sigma factor (sigma-70 family)
LQQEDLSVGPNEQVVDLGAVFVTHRAQLLHAALKILGHQESAEDVVQDAYLKVVEVAGALAVKQPLAYLFQVVRNLAIDRRRRATLEMSFFEDEEAGGQVSAPVGTPELTAISRQDLALVSEVLARLPERTRRVFELHRLDGLTQREIAARLDISPTLVNFMIRDAMDRCRAAMLGS